MRRRQVLNAIPLFLAGWATATLAQLPVAQAPADEAAERFDQAAAKHKRELKKLLGWRGAPPPALQLPYASLESTTIALWEGRYPEQTAVLFYAYDGVDLEVWLVDELGIRAYDRQTRSQQQINQAIASLRASLNVASLQQARIPRPSRGLEIALTDPLESRDRTSKNLTQILLPTPIARELDKVAHLIIVPILGIGTAPYAILQPFGDDTLLIDRLSLSIAPSLGDLEQALEPWDLELSAQSPLIVGNPKLPESNNWAVPPLAGAEQEAQAVAKLMNAVPLLGTDATKTEIVLKASQSSFLYFATHGFADSQNPLSGGFLMLSARQLEQGWWTAREIQRSKLNAEIVVLSACQTGLGKVHNAGIIGLSRAFQIAGVPRVVMSLWTVDDEATSQLMQAFVKYLATHIPAQALRQAMLEVRQNYPDPAKWASFVLFGTPR